LGEEDVATRGNEPPPFENEESPDLSSPGEGFELYRHKDAEKMRTKGARLPLG
jgi:hypothetical protein